MAYQQYLTTNPAEIPAEYQSLFPTYDALVARVNFDERAGRLEGEVEVFLRHRHEVGFKPIGSKKVCAPTGELFIGQALRILHDKKEISSMLEASGSQVDSLR